MGISSEAWRRRIILWTIPLVFCVANALGVAVYQARYSGNVAALEEDMESMLKERTDLRRQREAAQSFLEEIEERHRMVESLYTDHFSTEEKRLTDMIREAKRLARQAGLDPKTVSYPKTNLAEGELYERHMVFPVQGTYYQLRTFMNFLELTDQFLILERISLSGGVTEEVRDPVLSVEFNVMTIFVSEEEDATSGGTS